MLFGMSISLTSLPPSLPPQVRLRFRRGWVRRVRRRARRRLRRRVRRVCRRVRHRGGRIVGYPAQPGQRRAGDCEDVCGADTGIPEEMWWRGRGPSPGEEGEGF